MLSNFYVLDEKIILDGIQYSTSEAAYQSLKSSDINYKEGLSKSKSGGHAKQIGRTGIFMTAAQIQEWDAKKEGAMTRVTLLKFMPGTSAAARLLATGNTILREDTYDMFWGGSRKGSLNKLGEILMKQRTYLRLKQGLTKGRAD